MVDTPQSQPPTPEEVEATLMANTDVTEEELDALKDEADTLHDGDQKAFTENLLVQNAPRAVLQIAELAQKGSTERVRLDAAKYIVERVLGPLNKLDPTKDMSRDPILQFLAKVQAN